MKLSIITVTFKDPEGLLATLRSLEGLHRTGINWEHIIVDSSPKITEAALSTLPSDWPLLHLSVPANGIYKAMNEGIAAANGSALCFLNGGDTLFDPLALRSIFNELMSSSLHMICAGCRLTRNGVPLYPKRPKPTFLESILYRNQLSHQAILYKAVVMKSVGEFNLDFRLAADYEHYFRCFANGMKVKCVQDLIVNCDLSGASNLRWEESLREASRATDSVRHKLPASIFWKHKIYSKLEFLRVFAIKTAREILPFGWARSIWTKWNMN